jgi:adenylate cyclase
VKTLSALIATLTLLVLIVIRLADPAPVSLIREAYFDTLQRLSPRDPADLPVRVVVVDEASLATLGQWPWPRTTLARIVDRLAELGAVVVGFDVLFPEADRLSAATLLANPEIAPLVQDAPWVETLRQVDNDVIFAAAMTRIAVVLGIADAGDDAGFPVRPRAGFAEMGDAPGSELHPLRSTTPLVPALDAAAAGIAGINVSPLGADGIVRTVPMVWSTPDGFLPGLALETLRLALGESTVLVMGEPNAPGTVAAVRIGDYVIPTTPEGELRLRYRADAPALYVPARDVLDPDKTDDIAPLLAGHIVLVGTSAAGLLDIWTTALGESVPGVSIHAQALEQILTETWLTRSDFVQGLEILSIFVLWLVVVVVMIWAGPQRSMAVGAIAAATVVYISWDAFRDRGVLFDATFPLAAGFVAFSVLTMIQLLVSDRERRLIRRSLSRYVAPGVLAEIERTGHAVALGGEMRDITVLFTDMRNFTALSERMSAQDLVRLLNDLFTALSAPILGARGTIDKFIGDEIMAFWGAPLGSEGHRRAACLAALDMRRTLADFNAAEVEDGRQAVALATGLASGMACVGNVGSRDRFNYTALGDTVNLAARIEDACRHVAHDIVLSDSTAAGAADLAVLPAGALAMKGIAGRVRVHILIGDARLAATPAFVAFAAAHAAYCAALAGGEAAAAEAALARLRPMAGTVAPGLDAYIDRLPLRVPDLRPVFGTEPRAPEAQKPRQATV